MELPKHGTRATSPSAPTRSVTAALEDRELRSRALVLLEILIVVDHPLEELGESHQLRSNLAPSSPQLSDHYLDPLDPLVGFLDGRPDFLDIALLYALINFIGTIAVLKFLRYGDLGKASEEEGDI